jgi:predicted RNA polymerase sigma factor
MSRCRARITDYRFDLRARGDLKDYHLLWAARADLLRRLGPRKGAAES